MPQALWKCDRITSNLSDCVSKILVPNIWSWGTGMQHIKFHYEIGTNHLTWKGGVWYYGKITLFWVFPWKLLELSRNRRNFNIITNKKNEILLPNSYFSINANNRTWFSLYIPSKFVSFKFFTNLTEKLGYHSNEIGKNWIFPFILFFFTKEWYCMGNNWKDTNFEGMYKENHVLLFAFMEK
jgi:hypothetical protein